MIQTSEPNGLRRVKSSLTISLTLFTLSLEKSKNPASQVDHKDPDHSQSLIEIVETEFSAVVKVTQVGS